MRSASLSLQTCFLGLTLAVAPLSGCGSDDNPPADVVMELAPPPAGQGMQFRIASTIDAGQEIERCQFVQAPPEGLNINREEVRYTQGSHHVLLYLTPYTSIPTTDLQGKTRDTSGVMDCAQGATADWSVTNVIGGAQSSGAESFLALPPDVAVKVPGNAVLLINAHYLNASPNALATEARINVYTIPDSAVKQEGGVLFFYNPFISVPGMESASARMRCPLKKDIYLANIQSHMHKRGVGYGAQLLDPSGHTVDTLYTNDSWEQVPVKKFDPARLIAAGSSLDYHCDYKNTEARTIVQGLSTRDEMCMLLASYYPRDTDSEYCDGGTFVGSGSQTCGASLSCAVTALTANDFPSLDACVVASCPGAADAFTKALSCIFTGNNGACSSDCTDPASAACIGCVQKGCQPLNDSCAAAACN